MGVITGGCGQRGRRVNVGMTTGGCGHRGWSYRVTMSGQLRLIMGT